MSCKAGVLTVLRSESLPDCPWNEFRAWTQSDLAFLFPVIKVTHASAISKRVGNERREESRKIIIRKIVSHLRRYVIVPNCLGIMKSAACLR